MDKDSYPPGDKWGSCADDITNLAQDSSLNDFEENNKVEVKLEKEIEELRDYVESKSTDLNEDSDAEIIADDRAEEYKEEVTGIKIKFTLTPDEIKDFMRCSRVREECSKLQRKHIVLQSILLGILILIAFISGSLYYVFMSIFPLLSLGLMWLVPFINMKCSVKKLLKEEEFIVEIYPDRLEIESKSAKREIYLNNVCESDEYNNTIMIFAPEGYGAIIPLRAIEPELRADVQAIIAAGTNPRWKPSEKNEL